jgi:hypothetical protein
VKVGDLVRIDPSYLREDESKIALITLYPDDEGYIFQEWGEQIAGECDCMVFWMGGGDRVRGGEGSMRTKNLNLHSEVSSIFSFPNFFLFSHSSVQV